MQPGGASRVGRAAAIAAVLSGAPSSAWLLVTGGDLLGSTRAAGTIAGKPSLVRGVVVHACISMGWTVALAAVLPRSSRVRAVAGGAVAGASIAALDLGVVAPRRYPSIAALPAMPQLLDHVAFGALVGWSLSRDR